MKDIIMWLKANWKNIKKGLIILGLLLLLLSFVSNWIQSGWYKDIKTERKALKEQIKQSNHDKDSIDLLLKKSKLTVVVLEWRSDSIKKASEKAITDMKIKEEHYLQVIADIKTVPADTVYKRIFAYNPNVNNDLLRYPFGSTQIKNIYGDHLALNYNIGLVTDLNKTLGLCNKDNQVKSSIIFEKDKQIGGLNGKLKINEGLITTLTSDNKLLEKAYKSERRWKGIWRAASFVGGGIIGYQILSK